MLTGAVETASEAVVVFHADRMFAAARVLGARTLTFITRSTGEQRRTAASPSTRRR